MKDNLKATLIAVLVVLVIMILALIIAISLTNQISCFEEKANNICHEKGLEYGGIVGSLSRTDSFTCLEDRKEVKLRFTIQEEKDC